MTRPPCPQCTNALRRAGTTARGARVWVCRWCAVVFYETPGGLVAFGGDEE